VCCIMGMRLGMEVSMDMHHVRYRLQMGFDVVYAHYRGSIESVSLDSSGGLMVARLRTRMSELRRSP